MSRPRLHLPSALDMQIAALPGIPFLQFELCPRQYNPERRYDRILRRCTARAPDLAAGWRPIASDSRLLLPVSERLARELSALTSIEGANWQCWPLLQGGPSDGQIAGGPAGEGNERCERQMMRRTERSEFGVARLVAALKI